MAEENEGSLGEMRNLINKNQADRRAIEQILGVSLDKLNTVHDKILPHMINGVIHFSLHMKDNEIVGGILSATEAIKGKKKEVRWYFDKETDDTMIDFLTGIQVEANQANSNKLAKR